MTQNIDNTAYMPEKEEEIRPSGVASQRYGQAMLLASHKSSLRAITPGIGERRDKDQDKNRGAVLINRYEREVNQADMTKATELANALDVPVAYLFAEDDDLAAAILAFAKLPAAERQRMRDELERLAGMQPG